MYTTYFGLHEQPFSIAPDPLYLFMSEQHREAMAHLQYGVQREGGFVLLTGEVGTGKTTLCRSFLEQLPEKVDVAFVLNPKLNATELLETVCDELHIARPENGSIKQLVDRLNMFLLETNAQGRKTVLIIDEAQNLSIDVLEQLRLLTNLETTRYKLLQLVLLGQPELLQVLNRKEMRQLSQRVTARYHLGPLGVKEVSEYVRHRLNVAGCSSPLFPAGLNKTLWQLTGGLPRSINLICDRALLGAYAYEKKRVDRPILLQAAREVLGRNKPDKARSRLLFSAAAACIFTLLSAAGYWFWATSSLPNKELLPLSDRDSGAQNLEITATKPERGTLGTNANSPTESLPQSWPMDFGTTQSREYAFADLAGLWGLSYPIGRLDYCSFAIENGLDCLARKDSLETLRNIDRPAMLTLYNDDGSPFYVVMAELGQDRARFVAGSQQLTMALPAIASRWFGEYLLLWRKPKTDWELLKPGESGRSVEWLARALDDLGLYEATGQERHLDGPLLGAFKHFQFDSGLTPDGVLGPMSLIRLNTVRNLTGPRLFPGGDS